MRYREREDAEIPELEFRPASEEVPVRRNARSLQGVSREGIGENRNGILCAKNSEPLRVVAVFVSQKDACKGARCDAMSFQVVGYPTCA